MFTCGMVEPYKLMIHLLLIVHYLQTILLLSLVGLLNLSAVAPDSAGIVEMVNGLAYGKSVCSLSMQSKVYVNVLPPFTFIITRITSNFFIFIYAYKCNWS